MQVCRPQFQKARKAELIPVDWEQIKKTGRGLWSCDQHIGSGIFATEILLLIEDVNCYVYHVGSHCFMWKRFCWGKWFWSAKVVHASLYSSLILDPQHPVSQEVGKKGKGRGVAMGLIVFIVRQNSQLTCKANNNICEIWTSRGQKLCVAIDHYHPKHTLLHIYISPIRSLLLL